MQTNKNSTVPSNDLLIIEREYHFDQQDYKDLLRVFIYLNDLVIFVYSFKFI